MELKSIIHSTQPNKTIPYESFEDVRLDTVLPKNVLEVMTGICTAQDLAKRQEVFSYLIENGTAELEALYSMLLELKQLYSAYKKADSDTKKQYIFAPLLYKQTLFVSACVELRIDKGFFAGFKQQLTALYDKELFDIAHKVYTSLQNQFFIEQKDNCILIDRTQKTGFLKELLCCADEMNIAVDTTYFNSIELSCELADSYRQLYPELAATLEEHYVKYSDRIIAELLEYGDQIDFYVKVTALTKRYTEHKIPYCYAVITDKPELVVTEAYDITLMSKQCYDIIPNDIRFDAAQPLFFLSGANGGGKTTYLRACGVCVSLALNGCPVPAVSARLAVLDSLLTHFPKDERFDLEGRFLDEQNRVDALVSKMGQRSLILLNETYATTNEAKSAKMTLQLAQRLKAAGQFCIYVTHQRGAFDPDIPMLCCVVDKDDQNKRTYKICRVSSSATSHAQDVLSKYSLSRTQLEARFQI